MKTVPYSDLDRIKDVRPLLTLRCWEGTVPPVEVQIQPREGDTVLLTAAVRPE